MHAQGAAPGPGALPGPKKLPTVSVPTVVLSIAQPVPFQKQYSSRGPPPEVREMLHASSAR